MNVLEVSLDGSFSTSVVLHWKTFFVVEGTKKCVTMRAVIIFWIKAQNLD